MKRKLHFLLVIVLFASSIFAINIEQKDLLERGKYQKVELLRIQANNDIDHDFRSGVYIDDNENVYISYNFLPRIEVYNSKKLLNTIKWEKDANAIKSNVRYYVKINHEGFIMIFPESTGFKTFLFDNAGNEIGTIDKSKRYEKCEFNGNEIYVKKTGDVLYKVDQFKNNDKKPNNFKIETNDNGEVTNVIVNGVKSFVPKTYLDYFFSDVIAIDNVGNIYCGYASKPYVVGDKYTGEMNQKLGVLKLNEKLEPLEFFEGSQIINEKNGIIYSIEQKNGEIIVCKCKLL